MKVLCVADHVDPLVYSPAIKSRFGDVRLVLGAGDLPLSYYDFIMSTLNTPLLFVFGNHNLRHMHLYRGVRDCYGLGGSCLEPGAEARPTGATYIGNRARREGGVLLAGLGGSMWYNGGENQYTELQTTLRILRLAPRLLFNRLRHGRYLDILLTHAPPRGIHDGADPCHRGFRCFLWFMRVFRPRYLVHGHTHLYSPQAVRATRYADTTVLNAYDHAVLELEVGS